MKTFVTAFALVSLALTGAALAEDSSYIPSYDYSAQPTIETFTPPAPQPTTYPQISGGRLEVSPDMSFGGSAGADGVSGNVQFGTDLLGQ